MAKIETIEEEAYELYQEFLKKKARRKQDAFVELDRETRSSESIKKAYDRINSKINTSYLGE